MNSLNIISLTFDDGLHQHLDNAIPLLNEVDLRASFYVHLSAESLANRLDEWKAASEIGHELGNHSIFHAATERKQWVREGNAIEEYSVDRMQLELETASDWLHAIDGHCERTFAYPCSNTIIGRWGIPCRLLARAGMRDTRWPGLLERSGLDWGTTRTSFIPVVQGLFVGARGGGLRINDEFPEPTQLDRFQLQSAACENHNFDSIRAYIERGLAAQHWPILQFHGVGGGHHMDCSLEVFSDTIRWLSDHHAERVLPIREGIRRAWGSSQGELECHSLTESS